MSNDFEAAVNEPVIVVLPVIVKSVPSNLMFDSPFNCPAVPVAVTT